MKTKYLLLLSFILSLSCIKSYSFDGLLFKPLTANHLESRIGLFSTNKNLRLDIGHSLDMYEFISDDNLQIRAGGDFFILSRLRSEGKMKFPVETSDFFFGLNGSANFRLFEKDFSTRLRIAHISAHLVDGYFFSGIPQESFVYSREFVDLVLAWIYENRFRFYIGGTYIFSTIPKNVDKFVLQIGADFQFPINNVVDLVGGYDLKSNKAWNDNKWYDNKYNEANFGNNSFQLGVLINLSKNVGISLNYYSYSGYSIHGMFYDQIEKYNALGVQINY